MLVSTSEQLWIESFCLMLLQQYGSSVASVGKHYENSEYTHSSLLIFQWRVKISKSQEDLLFFEKKLSMCTSRLVTIKILGMRFFFLLLVVGFVCLFLFLFLFLFFFVFVFVMDSIRSSSPRHLSRKGVYQHNVTVYTTKNSLQSMLIMFSCTWNIRLSWKRLLACKQ